MRGNVFPTKTDPSVHFIGALAQNGLLAADIPINSAVSAGYHCRAVLRHLVVLSAQQLAWELAFYGKATGPTAGIGPNSFLAAWRFSAMDGVQYGGVGPFYYQAMNIDLPYQDFDFGDLTIAQPERRGGLLHLVLLNRSPTTKLAGDAGAIQITAHLEPTYG